MTNIKMIEEDIEKILIRDKRSWVRLTVNSLFYPSFN